jgi:toxin ParE1/3/4
MSCLHWSQDAETDLDTITAYIARDDVIAAIRMRDEIERRLEVLAAHPRAGRRGRVSGTRELVLAGTPYIGVYRVRGDDVVILRVLHGARRWPPSDETRA